MPSHEDRAAAAGWLAGGTWLDQHEAICAIGRERKVELVFLGDSITQSFGGEGRAVASVGGDVWQRRYADRAAANFGISGDRTQHVLWRIENGAFDDADPQLIVVMIGTNNVGHDEPDAIARGIEAVVGSLLERLPSARVLLLGIFPRGASANDPGRTAVAAVNGQLAERYADGRTARVVYRDLAASFLQPDGSPRPGRLAADHLHLSAAGYAAWAEAIEADLDRLLRER